MTTSITSSPSRDMTLPYAFDMSSPRLIDVIKANKGWTDAIISSLTTPTYQVLDNTAHIASYLSYAKHQNKVITIYPDYDMDGISAACILYAGLAELGFNVHLFIPDYNDERAMTAANVDSIMRIYPDTDIIITCDVGISSNPGLNHAHNAYQLTTIVTDHHTEDPDDPCVATYVLNPNRHNSHDIHKDICGAQVAFHLVHYFATYYMPTKKSDINLLRLFAGIGSLADVMPIIKDNRGDISSALALLCLLYPDLPRNYYGKVDARAHIDPYNSALIQIIHAGNHHPYYLEVFHGMAQLITQLAINNKMTEIGYIDTSLIGYTIAPIFNTTRRIEGDMRDNFAVFSPSAVQTASPDYTKDPNQAIATLINNNERRKEMVVDYLSELIDPSDPSEQPFAPYVYFSSSPPGMRGLLASSLLKRHAAPTVVLNPFTFEGSGRSVDGISLLQAAQECSEKVHAAGHDYACGVDAHDVTGAEELYQTLKKMHAEWLKTTRTQVIHPDLNICYGDRSALQPQLEPHFTQVNPSLKDLDDLIDDLHALEPFGYRFEYPTISITFDHRCIVSHTLMKNKHIKIVLNNGLTILKWNSADIYPEIANAHHIICTVELGRNNFRDVISLQAIAQSMTIIPQDDGDED